MATLAVALLLTAGIVGLALADDNEANAALLLLVVPIGLVAAEFGWPGGMIAAAASLGLFAVWNEGHGGGAGPIGYLTRGVVFFGFAGAVGLLLGRASSFSRDRPDHLLVKEPLEPVDGPAADGQLSPRELEVLELIARGATNARIAAQFVISEETVKSHVKHIFQKLEVGNRTEAALRYLQVHGPPSQFDPPQGPRAPGAPAHHQTGSARPDAASEHNAEVAGFLPSGGVLVRLDSGRTIEVPLLDDIRNLCKVGSPALIYFDHKGTLVGCYLPEAGIGVDMQGDRRRRKQ